MKTIPPFKLVPEPLNADAASLPKFNWADEETGRRHRLGGEPDSVQELDWPVCPECQSPMTFYAQLDSINDEFCLADSGMIHVFVCMDCYTVSASLQSY